MRRTTTRRAVLRGLGGVCLALPFLELFRPHRAGAATPVAPKRYVVMFGGSSIGMDSRDMVAPASEGALDPANLTRGLLPLGDEGVTGDVSVVTGLEIPYGKDGSIPAGGRAIQWHSSSMCPLLSGVRSKNGDDESLQGETSDWLAAKTLAGPTADTRPVLSYRVQPAYYRGTNGTGGNRGLMSARIANGKLEKVTPQFSPHIAFEDLFTGFVPPDPEEAKAAQFLLNRRMSVIDLVKGDTERLLPKLGAADKVRLQRHFDELRALEKRLQATKLPDGTACKMLPDPGDDPPIGNAVENGDTSGYDAGGAWSDEEQRAITMVDLIHMAFVCDLSRVASLMFTYAQCFLNMKPVYGYPSDLHELGHYSMGGGDKGANAVADGVAWHVRHFARLVKKLRDTEDVDGSTLLDNTGMVLVFEGGWGYDPEQDKQGTAHSSENMVVLAAGHAGGLNAKGGVHVRAQGQHPVRVTNTVLGAVGVPDQLGEVSGTIDGLVS